MDDPRVLAAVIAAVTSIVVSFITAYVTTRQSRQARALQSRLADQQAEVEKSIEQQRAEVQKAVVLIQAESGRELEHYKYELRVAAEQAERLRTVTVERARYWTPLQEGADDLFHRIRNIRELGFPVYFSPTQPRRTVALQSTFYRFAKYWGAAQSIYEADPLLRLEDENPKAVETMATIGMTFTDDGYGQQFMVWREEQRAIAELVLVGTAAETPRRIMGFATFAREYEAKFAAWFAPMTADFDAGGTPGNQRLSVLQSQLQQLVNQLRTPDRPATANPGPTATPGAPTQPR